MQKFEELKIRSFLKELSNETLADSDYLLGIDFENAPIETIVASLIRLYDNVAALKLALDLNMPMDKITEKTIITDFKRKQSVLFNLMSDNWIYAAIMRYKIAQRKKHECDEKNVFPELIK